MEYIGGNFINGSFLRSETNFPSINPSNEEIIGYFPMSNSAEVDAAVVTAKEAQKSWKKLSRIRRGEYINALCNVIQNNLEPTAVAISQETGKTLNESRAEVVEAIHMLQYTFGRARMPIGEIIPSEFSTKTAYVMRKPKGVVGVICPWNFPFAICFWNAAPALLEGNTVVFKPSEESPLVGELIANYVNSAGLPPGVFNLIHGDGTVGEELVKHPNINHICFTGSYEVGKQIRIACAEHGKKTCSCEMGSKSAVIVCADASFDMSVQAAFTSAFKLSGQRCVSASRILIEDKIYEEFVIAFANKSRTINIGDPMDENTQMGPLISYGQFNRVLAFNQITLGDPNTEVVLKGYPTANKGFFLSPQVYKTKWAPDEDRIFLKTEVFGPHVALIPFSDIEEAIRIYNDTDYALSLGVITEDFRKAEKIQQECDFGLGYWNGGTIAAESHLPFGGLKHSGYGGSSAAGTFDSVVHKVTWTTNYQKEIVFPQGMK